MGRCFYSKNNNLENFHYNNRDKILFKSKKISKFKVNRSFLYKEKDIFISDSKEILSSIQLTIKKLPESLTFIKNIKSFSKILTLY